MRYLTAFRLHKGTHLMCIAVIVLNRNLAKVTDKLCGKLLKEGVLTSDLFVIEAGSDDDNLSKYCTWYVRDKETTDIGLRYNRGMNQALVNLYQTGKWETYDAFLLLTNDTEFTTKSPTQSLFKVLSDHPRVALLSPCSESWGKRVLLIKSSEKYFWNIGTTALLVRRAFIDTISNKNSLSNRNFLFDGSNFRGLPHRYGAGCKGLYE